MNARLPPVDPGANVFGTFSVGVPESTIARGISTTDEKPLGSTHQSNPTPGWANGACPESHTQQTCVDGKSSPSTPQDVNPAHADRGSQQNGSRAFENSTGAYDDFNFGADRYQEMAEIGRGGCGIVVRAYDRQLQRQVVLKRVLPGLSRSAEVERRFLNEARITGQLEHPGIIPVHELGFSREYGVPFYAMKWLQGQTLDSVMDEYHRQNPKAHHPRGLRELIVRFQQVTETLAYAHKMGVVHRDLKPSNVFIGQFGETVVLDWGLAKRISATIGQPLNQESTIGPASQGIDSFDGSNSSPQFNSSSNSEYTIDGSVLGTAAYMSPEQARGRLSDVGYYSDVFSLGAMLYEILTNRLPFQAGTVNDTIELVAQSRFAPIRNTRRDVPRSLVAICEKCLSLEPSQRYPDAQELTRDIECFLASDTVSAYREPWWGRIDRLLSRNRLFVRSAGLALFVTALVAIFAAGLIARAHQSEKQARIVAQNESTEKSLALDREQAANSETITQLRASRTAVDTWLIGLSGDLQFYPGLTPLRNQLLERAHKFYLNTSHPSQDQASYQLESARSRIRLADIERMRGDINSARDNYDQALSQLNAIADPPKCLAQDIRIETVNGQIGMNANILAAQQEPQESDLAQSEGTCAEAKRLCGEFPESKPAKGAFIRANQIHSRLLARLDRFEESAERLSSVITLAELLMKDGGDCRDADIFGSLLEDYAANVDQGKDTRSAIDAFQDLVHFYTQRCRETPRTDWLEARGHAHLKLGTCRLRLAQPWLATDEFRSAEEDFQTAWNLLSGELALRENLAVAGGNQGLARLLNGDAAGAVPMLRGAIDSLRWLVQHEGAGSDRVLRMARCYLWLVTAIQDESPEESGKILSDARILIDHLLQEKDPTSARALDRRWNELHAQELKQNQDWPAVERWCQSRLDAVHEDATALSTSEIDLHRASLLVRLAEAQRHLGSTPSARESAAHARQLLLNLSEDADPRTAVAARRELEQLTKPTNEN